MARPRVRGWCSATSTTRASSCGAWATRAATAPTTTRSPAGSASTIRAARCTTRARPFHDGWVDGGLAATDLVCPMYPPSTPSASTASRAGRPRRSSCASTATRWATRNGSLADYWDVITTTPGLQGGFLWEWKDHGLRQRAARRHRAARLRRPVRRDAPRRQLRRRRPGVGRPGAASGDARGGVGVPAGHRRTPGARRARCASTTASRSAASSASRRTWELLVDGAVVAARHADAARPLRRTRRSTCRCRARARRRRRGAPVDPLRAPPATAVVRPAGHLVAWDQVELRAAARRHGPTSARRRPASRHRRRCSCRRVELACSAPRSTTTASS